MPLTIRHIQSRDIGPLREMTLDFLQEVPISYPYVDEPEIDKHMLGVLSSLDNPDSVRLIAYDGKKPVGFFLGYIGVKPYAKPSKVGIGEQLYVVPNKRNGIIAVKLLKIAAKYAKSRGAEGFECVGTYDGTIKFWEKHGFKPHVVFGHLDNEEFERLILK